MTARRRQAATAVRPITPADFVEILRRNVPVARLVGVRARPPAAPFPDLSEFRRQMGPYVAPGAGADELVRADRDGRG